MKVLAMVGSLRQGSYNKLALRAAIELKPAGMEIESADIGVLPLYNDDVREAGYPPPVQKLREQVRTADALLFVTPEHNRSLPAVLKNAIDWGARPYGQNSWSGKPAAITGTSPGALGTAAAQLHLRQVLGTLGALVMGGEAYISFRPGLLDSNGTIADETTRGFLKAFIDQFAATVARSFAREAAA